MRHESDAPINIHPITDYTDSIVDIRVHFLHRKTEFRDQTRVPRPAPSG